MSHAVEFQTSPYGSQIAFLSQVVPDDLRELVEQGAQVARKMHPDYPRGIWFDNVRVHAIRCALTAEHLKLPANREPIRSPLVRTLWLHDLPEVVTSLGIGYDTSAVIKEDRPDIAAKISSDEDTAAKKIFSASDYELFSQFEAANSFLEGKLDRPNPSIPAPAYGARIIDIGDAEMCFYHFLTAWLIHESFDGRLPTERPYRFTMKRYSTYLTNTDNLAPVLPPELLRVYNDLLLGQIRYITNRWALVERHKPSLMPEIAMEHVAHLRSLLPQAQTK